MSSILRPVETNRRKDELLGEPHGTASNRLRKMLLFKYVQLANHDTCYRCSQRIEKVEDFSIEHTVPWQAASAPRATFFDLGLILFSHLKCNCVAGDKKHPPRGHGNAGYKRGCRCTICFAWQSGKNAQRDRWKDTSDTGLGG